MSDEILEQPQGDGGEGRGGPTFEPAGVGAPVAPVRGPRPRSRARWSIALALIAAIVGASATAAWLLTGQASTTGLARWMPSDSIVFVETRFDLPGDQRQNLGAFLAHLPGFADQSILDQKLAEVYDRVIRAATQDRHDFSTDIKPWFGGQVGVAVVRTGSIKPDPSDSTGTISDPGRGLMAVSVTNGPAAAAWVTKVLGERGATYTTETHAGVTVDLVGTDPSVGAVAVTGEVMLLGDRASVEAALDRNGSGGLATVAQFERATAAASTDHLVGAYVDLKGYLHQVVTEAGALGAGASAAAALDAVSSFLPDWVEWTTRAESDALVSEIAMPHNAGLPAPANAATTLAAHVPASTIAFFDANDYGATIQKTIDLYRSVPADAAAFAQLDQAVNRLGGYQKLLGWIGETAVVVTRDGTTPSGGIVIVPKDRSAADSLATSINNLLALGGGSSGITLRQEPYAGTTITVADLGDATSGALAGLSLPPGAHAELAWAVTDQVVAVGFGDAFVKSVLDTKAESSLASDARFSSLVARVGDHASLGFVDLTTIRTMIEAAVPATQHGNYDTDIKPYLVPFDALVVASRTGGDLDTTRIVVTVK